MHTGIMTMMMIQTCAKAPTGRGNILSKVIHHEARALFRLDGKTQGTTVFAILYTHGVDLGAICVFRNYA